MSNRDIGKKRVLIYSPLGKDYIDDFYRRFSNSGCWEGIKRLEFYDFDKALTRIREGKIGGVIGFDCKGLEEKSREFLFTIAREFPEIINFYFCQTIAMRCDLEKRGIYSDLDDFGHFLDKVRQS